MNFHKDFLFNNFPISNFYLPNIIFSLDNILDVKYAKSAVKAIFTITETIACQTVTLIDKTDCIHTTVFKIGTTTIHSPILPANTEISDNTKTKIIIMLV